VFDLEAGRYAYVGSALNGLEARTRRHLGGGGTKRWHIDYLMELSSDREAILLPSDVDIECSVADRVRSLPGASEPIAGFGSSDCRCRSHLFRLDDRGYIALKRLTTPAGANEKNAWSSGPATLIC
jgi:Uri superfamily endonuclease